MSRTHFLENWLGFFIVKIQADYLEGIKSDKDELKAFALYLKIKVRYKKGVVYNYTPGKIAHDLRISKYEANKYVEKMCDMELCQKQYVKDETRLLIAGFKKIKVVENGTGVKLNIHFTDKLDVVITKIRGALLRFNIINKQLYLIDYRTDLDNLDGRCSRGKYKSFVKKHKKLREQVYNSEKVDKNVYAGYRKMADVCGTSISSIRSLLERLTRWNYIKGWERYIEETNLAPIHINSINKYSQRGRYFIKNGTLYLSKGTILKVI